MKYSTAIKLNTKEIYTMWNNINGIFINTHNNIYHTSKNINRSISDVIYTYIMPFAIIL